MKNTTNAVRTISEVGIFAALGFVFDELQGIIFKGVFPNGGSIGFAMIAVLIIAYRRGFLPALVTGLIMGLLDIATSAFILHPAQLFLDYILPYAFVALAGLLKPLYDRSKNYNEKILWLISGTVIGGFAKFLSHYFAGVIFWYHSADFAWGLNNMHPWLYSFVYNIAYMAPCIVLTAALLLVVQSLAPKVLTTRSTFIDSEKETNTTGPMVVSFLTASTGLFFFIFFLVKYISSFYAEAGVNDYGEKWFDYSFDPDSMYLTVMGIFLVVLGVVSLIKVLKNDFSYVTYTGALSAITTSAWVFGLYRLIKITSKGKDPTLYWIWFAIGGAVMCAAIALLVLSIVFKKKRNESII
ncbi:MAG: energy-coupled thiamine transporter ThiT [Bacilli bacterium]|nr:energy-coupled thiamine transporter ThiT [Bacilli bacterium]